MHEMGEIKRAQELQVEEVSVQKLRENHETIQQLSSQLQQMQEPMNSINDSGDFQDVESNYSERLSHVSSQPVMIPSSRSLPSRDKRLPIDTWNESGFQDNFFFFEINFLRLIQPEIILVEFNLTTCKATEKQSLKREGRRLFTQVRTENHGTIPMPTFATKPLTTSYAMPVELQQRQQISELQFEKFPNPQSFLVWKNSIQKSSDCLF